MITTAGENMHPYKPVKCICSANGYVLKQFGSITLIFQQV